MNPQVVNQVIVSNRAIYFNYADKSGVTPLWGGAKENARKGYERSNRAMRMMKYGLNVESALRAAEAIECSKSTNLIAFAVTRQTQNGDSQLNLFTYAVGLLIAAKVA